ncbi:hypothetical protein [Sporosarcina sp. UB5]|uniref:hypothetical protein n=1 Tax=Sporosarcina sp. UB5 TaxID=3047463 RepID=UPI003D7A8012
METLILRVPKLYEKRNLMLEGHDSTDHIFVDDENGGFIAAESFISEDAEALVANYQSDELMMFKNGESDLIKRMLKRKVIIEPVETHFMMRPENRKK